MGKQQEIQKMVIEFLKVQSFLPEESNANRVTNLQNIYDNFPDQQQEIADMVSSWEGVHIVGNPLDGNIEIPAKYFE